jgi:predicted MFS family arabinose efflux permease
MATSVLFALGLVLMAVAGGRVGLFAAWAVMGLAMGSGLYEAAFASLVRLYGHEARGAITGITLIAGFASTVGWPLTAALEHAWGWRGACWAWAGLHLLLGCLSMPGCRAPSSLQRPHRTASKLLQRRRRPSLRWPQQCCWPGCSP